MSYLVLFYLGYLFLFSLISLFSLFLFPCFCFPKYSSPHTVFCSIGELGMNFDDEEHRVKRILGDDSENSHEDNSSNTTPENSSGETANGASNNTSDNSSENTSNDTLGSVENNSADNIADNTEDTAAHNKNDTDKNKEIPLDEGDISTSAGSATKNEEDSKDNKSEEKNKDNSKDKDEENEEGEGSRFIPPSQAPKEKDIEEEPMGLLGHLSELRRRLTRVVIILLIGFFGFYGVSELAYAYLAAPLTVQLPEGSKLIYTSPQGAFFTYLKVSLMLSILGTSPFTFYQLWAFIAPGLYKEEQKAIAPLAFFSAFFFITGAAFCYFMVFPIAFKFFLGFTSDVVIPMISVEEYLSFALKLIIAFGLVFEMPLFSYFLAKLRIISPEGMRKHRKYAVLAIFIVAAILTPPDVFSQVLMALPMLVLYEVSIYVAKVARGKVKITKTEETEEDINDKINTFK